MVGVNSSDRSSPSLVAQDCTTVSAFHVPLATASVSKWSGKVKLLKGYAPASFQRRYGSENRPINRSYIRECMVTTSRTAQITIAGQPLEWRPHDFRRIFVTDALRSGMPPHIAAKICGHAVLDTTMGYAAIYPEDVVSHHRAFIARRRAERPSEEYRELTAVEWDEFLAHFELRKVALGVCGRDYGTPCAHENACVRCPLLRVDPAQIPRLEEIRANLGDRLQEAREQGWLGAGAPSPNNHGGAPDATSSTRRPRPP